MPGSLLDWKVPLAPQAGLWLTAQATLDFMAALAMTWRGEGIAAKERPRQGCF